MKTEKWYLKNKFRYLLVCNIILTVFLVANKPIIETAFSIIANIDQNWLAKPFTYVEAGEESSHSPFYIVSSIITFIAVVVGAWAYSRQAKALRLQSEISNQTHIARTFETANSKLNIDQNPVEWAASISAMGDICVTDDKYIRRTKVILDEFSNALGGITPVKSVPKLTMSERILKNQISNVNRAIISVMYRINRDTNTLMFDNITDDYTAFIFSHLKIARKVLPHNNNTVEKRKVVRLNFENFVFYMCDLQGVHFVDCNFFNTRFYKPENHEFTGCVFGISDNDRFKSTEMDNCEFNDCFIWERSIAKYDISEEVIEADFAILDDAWFSEWARKDGAGRICDWSKYEKK